MLIITMKLPESSRSAVSHSQYIWHVGEPFPILPSWMDEVEAIRANGPELDLLRMIPGWPYSNDKVYFDSLYSNVDLETVRFLCKELLKRSREV